MAERAVHVSVTGRVQGVGFRDWVEREATDRRLAGWVRNRRNGTVEAVFSGEAEAVKSMLDACRQGPPAALVGEVITEDAAEQPGQDFRILPTA
jgi:acylphosphatase